MTEIRREGVRGIVRVERGRLNDLVQFTAIFAWNLSTRVPFRLGKPRVFARHTGVFQKSP